MTLVWEFNTIFIIMIDTARWSDVADLIKRFYSDADLRFGKGTAL